MKTQKTLHKQTAALIARIAENLPELPSEVMQKYIEKPQILAERLLYLQPTFRESIGEGLELIEIHKDWDFLILVSPVEHEVGIAVSNHDASCGHGFTLVTPNGVRFRCPNGKNIPYPEGNRHQHSEEAIRHTMENHGIKSLIISSDNRGWPWMPCPQFIDPLSLLSDHYDRNERMRTVLEDMERNGIKYLTKEGPLGLTRILTELLPPL